MRVSALDAAAKLLEQGDDDGALEALTVLWRDWPAPTLASIVEGLAERLSHSVPPVAGSGSVSARQAWLTLAAGKRAAALPRLIDALPDTTGPIAVERLEALRAWPASPVISARLTTWLERPPFEGKNRARCFPLLLEIVDAHRDPRGIAVMQKRADPQHRSLAIRDLGLASWKPLQALAKRAGGWAAAPKISEEEAAALGRLTKRLGSMPSAAPSVPLEALYAAVYDDPDDDQARLMLADVLQEAADPRGEFIALQMVRGRDGGPPTKREKTLADAWSRDWLGPLNPAVMKQGVVFDRGFLARCALTGEHVLALSSRPEWATVTHLDVAGHGESMRPLLLSPAMRELRHVTGVSSRVDLDAIVEAGRSLPWETLGLRLWTLDAAALALFARAQLPKLERLGLLSSMPSRLNGLDDASLEKLLRSPLAKTLRHLEVAMLPASFGSLIDFARTMKLTSISLLPTSRQLGLRFEVASRSVVVSLMPVNTEAIETAAAALKSMRSGTVDRVLIHARSRTSLSDAAVSTLKRAAGSAELVLSQR